MLPATLETTQWGWFDNSQPPVLRVHSGDTIILETMMHSHNQVVPGVTIEQIKKLRTDFPGRGPHTLTGPIYIEEAQPGDVLKVRLNRIIPRAYATNFNVPGMFGQFPSVFQDGQVKYLFLDLDSMGSKDGRFGYEMEIIVPADSPIKTPADIKGKKLAFTAPTSNSGFKAPSVLLESEFNLVAKRDYEPVFSGKHDNSVLGVANKDYEAAAIANEVMVRMFERKVVDPAKIRTVYKSETFPTTSYGMAHNLDPVLQEKIKEAFFTFPWEGSALKAEFKTEDRFVPITYQKDWNVVRKIDAASGVKYACK